MKEKTLKRNKLTLRFLRWIRKHFNGVFIAIVCLACAAFIAVLFYAYFLIFNNNVTKQNIAMSVFAITTGFATIIGVSLAISEFRLKFETITNWKDFLKELTHLLNEAEKYVVMFTYYPTVGMISLKKGNDFDSVFNYYKDSINDNKDRIKIVGYFLKESDMNDEIEIIAKSVGYIDTDVKFFQKWSKKVIEDIRGGMSNQHKNCVIDQIDVKNMPDFHLFVSDQEGIIFIPLNLDKKITVKPKIEFIANATLDPDLILQFQNAIKYHLTEMKISTTELPF